MRLYDIELEMQVVRSAIASPQRMAQLRRLGGDKLFHYSAAETIFKRASKIIRRTGEAPTWKELTHDPQLPESIRETMAEVGRPMKKRREFSRSADRLEEYARIRGGADIIMKISDIIKEESVDPDEINALLAEGAQLTRKLTQDDIFRHFGTKGSRTGKDVIKTLMEMGKDKFVPTGFNSFDKQSRGFIKPSCVILASESGGGKSKMAGQMRLNMSLNGARCAHWSLEMDHDELEMRLISQLTQIPLSKLLFPERLTDKQKRKIVKCYDEYQHILRERNSFSSFAVPKGGMNIRELLDQTEPYGYDVVTIDYVSLLEDGNEDQQWRALSDAAAYGKVWSTANNAVLILLAQLKEDESLKLAKYMKDHANNMWCVPAGTLVDTPNGLISIEKLVSDPSVTHEGVSIPVMSDGKATKAVNFVNSGVQDVYRLRTHKGTVLDATITEKVKVLTPDFKIEWRRFDQLQEGDWIATSKMKNPTKPVRLPVYKNLRPYKSQAALAVRGRSRTYYSNPITVPKVVTPAFARMIGYLLADGCVSDQQVTFTSADTELLDDFSKCFIEVFGIHTHQPTQIGNAFNIRTENKNVIAYLKMIEGVHGGSRVKFIPDVIMQSSNELLAECIGAMIACDGNVRTDRVTYFTTSEKLSQRFHIALQRLGIRPSTRYSQGKEYGLLTTTVAGADMKIAETIPVVLNRKKITAPKTNRSFDTIVPHLSTAIKNRGLKIYSKLCRKSVDPDTGAKLSLVEAHFGLLEETAPDLAATFRTIQDCGYIFEKFESLELLSAQQVYDISVPGNHTFVANGVVVHNTWKFGEREQETRIIHIKQQKARNQPMYDFYLKDDTDTMTIRDPTDEEMQEYMRSQGKSSNRGKVSDYDRIKNRKG